MPSKYKKYKIVYGWDGISKDVSRAENKEFKYILSQDNALFKALLLTNTQEACSLQRL